MRNVRRHIVVVARGAEYAHRLQQAIARLGGTRLVARRGERVVIKPTLTWNRTPEQGGNVHPEVLRATIELALQGGAAEVILFDRTATWPDLVYHTSHAALVVRRLNDSRVRLIHLTDADFVPFEIAMDRGRPFAADGQESAVAALHSYQVCRYLLEADRVVNVATARHHPTRQVALGMANLLGFIGGGPADTDWRRRQEAELAVLTAAVRPELTILDATRAVVGTGPVGQVSCGLPQWDTLVVSRDPVAVEAYGAILLGLEPAGLGHVRMAERLGLGLMPLDDRVIEI
jgi:uncharacterized protein (DUF362 family)